MEETDRKYPYTHDIKKVIPEFQRDKRFYIEQNRDFVRSIEHRRYSYMIKQLYAIWKGHNVKVKHGKNRHLNLDRPIVL